MAVAAAAGEAGPSIAEGKPEIQRMNEICLERRQCSEVTASLGEPRVESLSRGSSGASRVALGGGVGIAEVRNGTMRKRSVAREFTEHGFDTEFSFRIRFQKIGAGLENLGNTCYLNSVLQCLTYTEPFAAYLQSGKHKSTCRNAGFCAMCALQNHVMDALQSTGKILRPFHLVKNLRCISSNFRYSRQEDAHEYMVNLLESMHKCCLPNGVPSESPSAYEKSQVHKIFGGQLRSQVKCTQCSYYSNKFDPFLDLSLEIMKADSLRKALTHFTAMELLDGGERQYQCQRCKEKVKAVKQLTIHKAPYVLTIHLKRFDSNVHGEKLSKKVLYGPTLNLNPFISDPRERDYKYTLYGVLVHAGCTTYSGHYFCYVRTAAGMWYSLDDNQVTQVSEKTVLSREAYMLFYVRDRTIGVKGAVDVASKPDISVIVAGTKATPAVERKPSTAINSSVQPKPDGTCSVVSAMDASFQQSIMCDGLLFHSNEQVESKYSCLQGGDDILSDRHQTVPSKEPAKSLSSMDSKLPSVADDKKGNATNGNVQDNALAHRMETDHPLPEDDAVKVLRQSNAMNDSIQTEAVCSRMVDNRNNGPNGLLEFGSCSINLQLQKGGESFPKLPESKPVESLLSNCARQETPADVIPENLLYGGYQAESKLKKLRKSSSVKGRYFGSKQLFFMSLHLPKNKKKMRSKHHHLTSRKKGRLRIVDDPITDSQGASTSETFQPIDVCSRHPPKKHSHSYKKSKGKEAIKLGSSFVRHKEFKRKNMKNFKLETPIKSNNFFSCEGDSRVECKNAEDTHNQNFSLNLSLKQTSVARWDDIIFPAKQMNAIERNSKRKMDRLLYECGKDHDKAKRKKLKKSRQWFGVVAMNPLQETSCSRNRRRHQR